MATKRSELTRSVPFTTDSPAGGEQPWQLLLAPMTGGDLIDCAVQTYRRHWAVLLQIVIFPILCSYAGSIAMSVGFRSFSSTRGDLRIALGVLLMTGGFVLYVVGKGSLFFVLGGTARELLRHLAEGTPLSARSVYRHLSRRFWSLMGALLLAGLLGIALFIFVYFVLVLTGMVYVFGVTWLLNKLPTWMQIVGHALAGLAMLAVLLAIFLWIYERMVYLPQVIVAEGKSIGGAFTRAFALAGRDVRRIGALFFFNFYVAWSVFLLLLIPLMIYASLGGIDINPFGSQQPLWYNIAYQTLAQVSEILLAPILLVGSTLLYLDSRVRREGLDVDLLANRSLPLPAGAIPQFSPRSQDAPPGPPPGSDSGLTLLSLR